jgi:uncharacterized protein (TIGR01777 family)
MKILIAGGTGWIGQTLKTTLKHYGHEVSVISRQSSPDGVTWRQLEQEGLPPCDAVCHVAGRNLLDITRRWNVSFEQEIRESRISTTHSLVRAIKKQRSLKMLSSPSQPLWPSVYIGISGINYYANAEESHLATAPICDETSLPGTNYMSQLCVEWEQASLPLESLGIRRVIMRSGVVIGKGGGIMQQLYPPFWLGLGGPLSHGQQYLPWIHMDDLVGLFHKALKSTEIYGPINAVSPQLTRNQDFVDALSHALHRFALISVPSWLIRGLLGEQRSTLLLGGPKVLPKKAQDMHYIFRYPDIFQACQQVVASL